MYGWRSRTRLTFITSQPEIGSMGDELFLCRFTQIGLLRLLTNSHVMGSHVKSQADAWKVADGFCR